MSATTAPTLAPPVELPLWEASLPVLLAGSAPMPSSRRETAPEPRPVEPAPQSSAVPDESVAAAHKLLASARTQAEAIIVEARHEAVRICGAARREAAQALVEEQAEAFGEIMQAIRGDLTTQLHLKLAQLEIDAARLCTVLVESVIRRKIAEDDQVLVDIVRDGLGRMAGTKTVTVRVSPECEAVLLATREQLARELPTAATLEIVADETLSAGSALLQSANGEIDLQIESQVARLREAAEAALAREVGQGEARGPSA